MRIFTLLAVLFLTCFTRSNAFEKLTLNVPFTFDAAQQAFFEVDVSQHGPADSTVYFLMTAEVGVSSFQVALNDTFLYFNQSHNVDSRNSELLLNLTSNPVYIIRVISPLPLTFRATIAVTTNRTLQLTENQPQFTQLRLPDISDFYFTYQWASDVASGESFYCSFTNELDANYSVYATFDGSLPSPSNYQYNTSSYEVDEFKQGVYFGKGSPFFPSASTLITILVHLESTNYIMHAPIIASVVKFSPSQPVNVTLYDGQVTPMLHLRSESTIQMTFNATSTTSLYLNVVKELGSLVIYALSPDDNSQYWPSASRYTTMLDVAWWTDANTTVLDSKSLGVWRLVAINTQVMNPNASTLFSITMGSYSTPVEIPANQAVEGQCTKSKTSVLTFTLTVPDVNHDTTLFIRPADPLSMFYSYGMELHVATDPFEFPTVNTTRWNTLVHWEESYHWAYDNGGMQQCAEDAAQRGEPCVLYIRVNCANESIDFPVNFLVSAQRHRDVMPVDMDDKLPVIKASQDESAHFSIAVPDDHAPLHISCIPCVGRAYLYASQQNRYPSANSSAFKSQAPAAINQFTISPENLKPNGTTVYVTVRAVDDDAQFILRTYSYEPSEWSPINPPHSAIVQASSNSDVAGALIARWQPATLASWVGTGQYDVLYDVYVTNYDGFPQVTWSRCGFQGVTFDSVYGSGLKLAPDGYYEWFVDGLDVGVVYSINVFASFVNRTSSGRNETWYDSELIYQSGNGAASSGGNPTPDPDDHKSGEGAEIAEILAAVFLPLFLLAGAVAYYLHRRNKRMQEELSLQLPDIENLDTVTPATDRRRGRQAARQSNQYASLLGDDSLSGL